MRDTQLWIKIYISIAITEIHLLCTYSVDVLSMLEFHEMSHMAATKTTHFVCNVKKYLQVDFLIIVCPCFAIKDSTATVIAAGSVVIYQICDTTLPFISTRVSNTFDIRSPIAPSQNVALGSDCRK